MVDSLLYRLIIIIIIKKIGVYWMHEETNGCPVYFTIYQRFPEKIGVMRVVLLYIICESENVIKLICES